MLKAQKLRLSSHSKPKPLRCASLPDFSCACFGLVLLRFNNEAGEVFITSALVA